MDYQYLTFADVTRFLDAKAPVKACPSCAMQNWTLQYSRSNERTDVIFATHLLPVGTPFEANVGPLPQMVPFGRPILPLICNECGFMKIHDYEVVRKWVATHPVEPVKSQDVQRDGNSAT